MRYSCILALALVFLVPAANALSLGVSGGNGPSSVGATMTYEGAKKDSVDQNLKLQPASSSLENYWAFSGSGSTHRYAYGAWGGYAVSGFSISGSNAYTIYDFASSAWPYAVTAEALTSTGATDIYAYGYAYSSANDYAYVNTEVYDPYGYAYLYGYKNTAVGTSSFASASQTIDGYAYAPYGYTWNEEYANNRYGDTSYLYDYQNGCGYQYYLPYSSSWPSAAYADSSWTYVQNSMAGYAGSYDYAYGYAKPYSYSAYTSSKSSSGWNTLYQYAYTYGGYYDYAYNSFA